MSSVATFQAKGDDLKPFTFFEERHSHNSATLERKKRILFVDDDEELRALGQALLEYLGYEVVLAANGSEALEIYQHKKIDLVITDLSMPKMGGLELFQCIQELDPNAIVILCSGYDMAQEVDIALAAGAYDFLSKPFNIDDLSAMIANALETKH